MTSRIQLKRTRGWRLPANAVVVSRPSIWGNPFKVGEPVERTSDLWPYLTRVLAGIDDPVIGSVGFSSVTLLRAEDAVAAYSWWIIEQPFLMLRLPGELEGKDLACWCPLPAPGEPDHCHAANLLELVAELTDGDPDG